MQLVYSFLRSLIERRTLSGAFAVALVLIFTACGGGPERDGGAEVPAVEIPNFPEAPKVSPAPTPEPTPTPLPTPRDGAELSFNETGANKVLLEAGRYQLAISVGDSIVLTREESRSGRLVLRGYQEVILP